MSMPLELFQTILKRLRLWRAHDEAIGFFRSLDRRTLRDLGMDHYGITSIVFREPFPTVAENSPSPGNSVVN